MLGNLKLLKSPEPDAEHDDADGHEPMSAELAAPDSIGGEADDDAEDGEDRDEGGSSENLANRQHFIFKG